MRDTLSRLVRTLDGRELRVFCVLWTASSQRIITTTYSAIADTTGLGASTIKRALACLESDGLVRTTRRGTSGQTYELHPELAVRLNTSRPPLNANRSPVTHLPPPESANLTYRESPKMTYRQGPEARRRASHSGVAEPHGAPGSASVGVRSPAPAHLGAGAPAHASNPDAAAAAQALKSLGFSDAYVWPRIREHGPAVALAAIARTEARQPDDARAFTATLIADPNFRAEVAADVERRAEVEQAKRDHVERERANTERQAEAAQACAAEIEAERTAIVARLAPFTDEQLAELIESGMAKLEPFYRGVAQTTLRRVRGGDQSVRSIVTTQTFRTMLNEELDARESHALPAPEETTQ